MTAKDRVSSERYVALQAWLCGQMSPRAPHAADLFVQDRECLYDAFLSVLVGTGLGFSDYDDNRSTMGSTPLISSWVTSRCRCVLGE